MIPSSSPKAKFFCAVLYTDTGLLARAKELLSQSFGPIDFESEPFIFEVSDYYKAEMGWPIFRLFWSFEKLIAPNELAAFKIETNRIEDLVAVANLRKVNLDAGYLDYDKVVLASAKYNWQKIYLDLGIYADLTLRYEKGNYLPFPWSFPDFKQGHYNKSLLRIREIFKQQRKQEQTAK